MAFASRHDVIARTLLVIGLTVVPAACGADTSTGTVDSAARTNSNSSASPTSNLSVDFTASLIDGAPFTLRDQLAQRPIALWFWAPG